MYKCFNSFWFAEDIFNIVRVICTCVGYLYGDFLFCFFVNAEIDFSETPLAQYFYDFIFRIVSVDLEIFSFADI